MKEFRITKLRYIFDNLEYKNIEIDFKDFTLINGVNTSGKTGIFNTIDTMLGKKTAENIKFENKFKFTKSKLNFKIDNVEHEIEYHYTYERNKRKLSEIHIDNNPVALDKFNKKLTEKMFGTVFEDETKFGIRNMLIFNFFHEHNVGSPTVLLSKLREQFFYKNIQDTFQIALFKENNGIFDLKLELKRLNKGLNKLDNEIEIMKKSNDEIEEINNLLEGKSSRFQFDENAESILELHELKTIKKNLSKNEYLNAELDYLREIRLMKESTPELEDLEELLTSVKTSILRKKYVKDNITKSINQIQETIDVSEESKRATLLKMYSGKKFESLDLVLAQKRKVESDIKKIETRIDEYLNIFKNKIELVEFKMKSYLIDIENEDLKKFLPTNPNDFKIKIDGNSFDPVILVKSDIKGKIAYNVKPLSSHSLLTLFQICYIFALHEVALENEGVMLNFIIFDTYSQPFETNNKKILIDLVYELHKKTNVQIIMLDKDSEILGHAREKNVKIYQINDKLFERQTNEK